MKKIINRITISLKISEMAGTVAVATAVPNAVTIFEPKTGNTESGKEEWESDVESEDPGSLKVLFIVVGDRRGDLSILQVKRKHGNRKI